MRFNLSTLLAFAVTTQIVIATPMPAAKWNDKDPEALYKFGAVACGLGAFICNKAGAPIGQDVLIVGGICCSTAAAAVTASQGPGFQEAARKIGVAATIAKDKTAAGGKFAGQCIGNVCKLVINKVKGHRSIDEPLLSARGVNTSDKDEFLLARSAEAEPEIYGDAILVSRNAELEPKSDLIDLN